MHRRDLLIGALASVASATLIGGTAAHAEITCSAWKTAWRTCEVGLQVPHSIARQRCPNWCWAACIQAVFAMNGYPVDQEAIVKKIFGAPRCATTSGRGIVAGITGRWTRNDGDSFTAAADVLWDKQEAFTKPNAIVEAANTLAQGHPLIIGTLGHASVVTGMTYGLARDGRYRIADIVVRDPWPDAPNRRALTREERRDAAFLTKVTVSA